MCFVWDLFLFLKYVLDKKYVNINLKVWKGYIKKLFNNGFIRSILIIMYLSWFLFYYDKILNGIILKIKLIWFFKEKDILKWLKFKIIF